ncbi:MULTISPECIES: heavy-metal-associated domain-containing protein [Brucella/Ochrobactrum group]|uniref:Heavy-metal-associated domain-containing protein n=1 Tax=Brucella pseudintermedia TaxID=370111 RepID=A0ABY5UBE5_9HYPH|nr:MULTISPECIES: heavy-metal-associated domain-containing protein [Brucella/Ochrobactrum group]MCO7725819.1 heavy-metal-associated domain-containing protein [Brucella intermedia]NKE77326.1 heavy-metal-associated domain-containing protein [Ochrobactrum sp. MC-1LL]KAB2684124.1 heavy-metal-associated domain-containing protein [Brucella pseudintermedia]UWL60639.1 heavy-metal-associated domain-containing protein [Brucella pseudintermedia]WPM81251.1 heavy-metal-associated domain-containing protein [
MMKFSIPKMKCGGCADSVTAALRQLDAAAPVEIDLEKKEVEFGGNASRDAVLSALAAAGFPASNAQ